MFPSSKFWVLQNSLESETQCCLEYQANVKKKKMMKDRGSISFDFSINFDFEETFLKPLNQQKNTAEKSVEQRTHGNELPSRRRT